MAYSITVEQIGDAGVPQGGAVLHEAETAMEAVAIVTEEVDVRGAGTRRLATVTDAAGSLVMAYAGRAQNDGL